MAGIPIPTLRSQRPSPGDRPSAVVLGLYCAGNLGDDLLMLSVSEALSRGGVRPSVAVVSTEAAKRLTKLPVVPAPGISRHMLRDCVAFARAARTADMVILGGGGLFQDTHYVYTVATYVFALALAIAAGRNALAWGIGIGPFRRGWNRWLTRFGLRIADRVTVRDPESLRELGIRARIVEDAVWSLPLPPMEGAPRTGKIGLVLRDWPGLEPSVIADAVADVCLAHQARVALIPFEYSVANPRDWQLSVEVQRLLQARGVDAEIPLPFEYPELAPTIRALSSCDAVLSMRFHGVLLSLRASVPVCALDCAPKIVELLSNAGLRERLLPMRGLTRDSVRKALESLLVDRNRALRAQDAARSTFSARAANDPSIGEELESLKRPSLLRRGVALLAASGTLLIMVGAAVGIGVGRLFGRRSAATVASAPRAL